MAQGIFISYRRDDTRVIARKIYEALKEVFPRKKIFFDVEISEPGTEIIAKIIRELESCKVVLAIIGPEWNAGGRLENKNDFVRRELKYAMDFREQDKLKVLPVLVNGAALPRGGLPDAIAAIEELEYLEIGHDDDIPKIAARTQGLLPRYWVGSHADIVRWRLDCVDLLKQLIQLDIDEVPTIDAKPKNPLRRLQSGIRRLLERRGLLQHDPGDEGTAEQWALIFDRHPETWRLILDANDNIVAYWHVAPLNDEDYDNLIAGRFKAGMVTYDRLTLFEKKSGIYNLFFVITVVDERHRNAALYRHLFLSFFDVLEKLAAAEHPVFIAEVAADVWTPEGRKLAQGFGMRHVGRRIDDPTVLIYSVPVAQVLNDAIAKKKFQDLRERYQTAGFVLDTTASSNPQHRAS